MVSQPYLPGKICNWSSFTQKWWLKIAKKDPPHNEHSYPIKVCKLLHLIPVWCLVVILCVTFFFTIQKILISQPTTKIMTQNLQYIVLGVYQGHPCHRDDPVLQVSCQEPSMSSMFPISSLIQSPFEQKHF